VSPTPTPRWLPRAPLAPYSHTVSSTEPASPSPAERVERQAIALDGARLTPEAVVLVARARTPVALTAAARERNNAARRGVQAVLDRGDPLYGASTGVGALREYRVSDAEHEDYQLRLLRSHAVGAGRVLPAEVVRAAMATRANQIGAGGAGIAEELLEALVATLNAGLAPFTRELGSLGTGDMTALADIGLALLGEGHVWRGDELVAAAEALRDAGVAPGRLGARDGLAFMESNAVSVGHAALLVVDTRALLDAWLTVAALSFEVAAADPAVLDQRVHAARGQEGQIEVAARVREHLAGAARRTCELREQRGLPVQDPYPFRALPQVDGVLHDALTALARTVTVELNSASENALIVAGEGVALPNANFHAAPLANALDGLRGTLAQSGALIAARVSTLLDASLTGLPAFLARDPGPDSGAMMLEYTAHSAAAEVRSLALPVAAQTVSVARGVESHASLAPTAIRRAYECLEALRVLVATELVVAVRAMRLAGQEPLGAGTRALYADACACLDPELHDRPLHPDVEAARALLERWPQATRGR
jgi:histidine ammonia-lyase